MDEYKLEKYWSELPVGKANAVSYEDLMIAWGRTERDVRKILHKLSCYDNGDDFILIRSAKKGGGFYKTDDHDEMKHYREEVLKMGRSTFAPVRKINRVLTAESEQINLTNNMRLFREHAGYLQSEVCDRMKLIDKNFDVPLLSKMENGVCLPTWYQLIHLAKLYDCTPSDLINYD